MMRDLIGAALVLISAMSAAGCKKCKDDVIAQCYAQCGGGPESNICFPDPIGPDDNGCFECFCEPCVPDMATRTKCIGTTPVCANGVPPYCEFDGWYCPGGVADMSRSD
jgi:hypothetical protein